MPVLSSEFSVISVVLHFITHEKQGEQNILNNEPNPENSP